MFLNRARDRLQGPGGLGAAIAESVAHKLERFETGDPTRPRLGEYDGLVGTPVADLLSDRLAHFEVVVDDLPALRNVDPHADLVPARIMGGIVLRDPQTAVPPLAVAVNGVVAAVTRVYSFAAFGHALPWEALVDPALLRPGANRVGVFAIRRGPDGAAVLQEAPGITSHRRAVNLIAQTIPALPHIESSGFLPAEATVHGLFRWDHRRRAAVGGDRSAVSTVRADCPHPDDGTAEAPADRGRRMPAVRGRRLGTLGRDPSVSARARWTRPPWTSSCAATRTWARPGPRESWAWGSPQSSCRAAGRRRSRPRGTEPARPDTVMGSGVGGTGFEPVTTGV